MTVMSLTIYIDADACPVREETYKVSERHTVPVVVVSNSYIRIPKHPLFSAAVVSDSFDAADDYIAERADKNSIVITADILLAGRCLEAGAVVIAPNGKPFDNDSIGALSGLNGKNKPASQSRGVIISSILLVGARLISGDAPRL